jgi:hypothetical protein
MVGSGFDDDSTMAIPFMRVLTGCAMRVKLTRIETAGPEKKKWWTNIANYLISMPNFNLFVPKNSDDILPKFCNACIKIVGKGIILKEFNKINRERRIHIFNE